MKALDEHVTALAGRQHGAFARRQLSGASRSAGDRRVASGVWQGTGFRGVHVLAGYPPSWEQRLMIAVLASPTGTVASHRSAAVLWGLRGGAPIEVTVPHGRYHQMAGVLVHQTSVGSRDRITVAGIPTTTVERTMLDLATVLEDEALERVLEASFRGGRTTPERLKRQVARRPGAVRLRRVLERRRDGRPAGSELEVRLIQLLRAAGLPDPVRQYEVRVGGARYFLDLAYPDRRLAIELDGFEEHGGKAAFQRDRTRQNALVLAGWTMLRFTWGDVAEHPNDVVALVAHARAA